MAKTEYELERERRIAANKQKMAELGVDDAVAAVQQLASPTTKVPRPKRKAAAEPKEPAEVRRSARPRTEVSYVEVNVKGERVERDPIDYTEKIKSLQLDAEDAEKLRTEMAAKRASEKKARPEGKRVGPKDSGKGLRVQGGRVYDSKFGVTCHWCRQKTLEAHVTCTNPKCAKGKMPYSFCHKCLKNRHGEDAEAAAATGQWVCPACRGSCGAGCITCCNCGPCRKKAGLEPTAQIVFLARAAGFSNVHDYLVHLVTGEEEEEIAARKDKHDWAAWLRDDPSEDSAQTHAAAGGGGGGAEGGEASAGGEADERPAEEEQEEGPARKKQARGRKGASAAGGRGGQAGAAAAQAEGAAAPAGRAGKKPAGRGSGKKRAAAAETAEVAEEGGEGAGQDASDTQVSQDQGSRDVQHNKDSAKLSRKARMMQRMGLAPRADAGEGEAVAA